MGVEFTIIQEKGYYLSKFIGKVTDKELLESYKNFFMDGGWIPGLNELADLSDLDSTELTSQGLEKLSDFIENKCKSFNVRPKSAVFAPRDLEFGLARMYEARANIFEDNRVFRDKQEAINWLSKY